MATQSVVGKLDKHFDKPLVKLSPELRELADAYIPKWSELSAIERKAKAQEADRQRDVKTRIRIGQFTRSNEKVPQRVRLPDGGAKTLKVIFWLAPRETLIPADQIPGAIADTLYPPPEREEEKGQAPNDPNAVKRQEAEREQAKQLRIKFPHLKEDDKFSIGDLNDYLGRLGMVAELRYRSLKNIEAAENTIGRYDATLSAAMWFGLRAVRSQEAAMLLCQFNPHDDQSDPLEVFNPETGPDDFKLLLRVFEDVANADSQPRSLQQWLVIARDKGLKYHSWIDEYAKSQTVISPCLESAPVESAYSGTPESSEQHTFMPRIGWQVALYESWPAMRKLYGRDPSPANAIKYLKKNDNSGTILTKGAIDELWWAPRRGAAKEVAFRTVENTISSWRTRGVLPA